MSNERRKLSEAEIIELGKRAGNIVNGLDGYDLIDPVRQAEAHLGLVVTKDAMLNDGIAEVLRTVPEDIDS